MKTAFITGITGQDGSYLAELLLKKGYIVHGLIRRSSSFNTSRIDHLYQDPHDANVKLFLHYGDLSDGSVLNQLLKRIKPDEVYHLGAQSHVRVSFDIPEYTGDVTALGTVRLLDAIRESGISTKFYQASSSEIFGKTTQVPQNENTPFMPRSPYAISKLYAFWMTRNYREAYNMFASNGILFNHESPRRGQTFVTRKISIGLSKIKLGTEKKLFLGNLDAKRDWGYAKEYVEAMWLILQQSSPDDFVIATGESHSLRDFVEEGCRLLDIDLEWQGKGVNEKGIDKQTGNTIIEIDPKYFRPTEVDILVGDPGKAEKILGWRAKTKFKELVSIMIKADMDALKGQSAQKTPA